MTPSPYQQMTSSPYRKKEPILGYTVLTLLMCPLYPNATPKPGRWNPNFWIWSVSSEIISVGNQQLSITIFEFYRRCNDRQSNAWLFLLTDSSNSVWQTTVSWLYRPIWGTLPALKKMFLDYQEYFTRTYTSANRFILPDMGRLI